MNPGDRVVYLGDENLVIRHELLTFVRKAKNPAEAECADHNGKIWIIHNTRLMLVDVDFVAYRQQAGARLAAICKQEPQLVLSAIRELLGSSTRELQANSLHEVENNIKRADVLAAYMLNAKHSGNVAVTEAPADATETQLVAQLMDALKTAVKVLQSFKNSQAYFAIDKATKVINRATATIPK